MAGSEAPQKPAERNMLRGRGGAGNIAPRTTTSPPTTLSDLSTPTIKSDLYTTGRGGTGNMATNLHSHPELARAAQDVEVAPIMGAREPETGMHYGRGGAANFAPLSADAKRVAKERNARRRRSEAEGTVGMLGRSGGGGNKEERERERDAEREREAARERGEVREGKEREVLGGGVKAAVEKSPERVSAENGAEKTTEKAPEKAKVGGGGGGGMKAVQQGFAKLTRAISSNGQAKK